MLKPVKMKIQVILVTALFLLCSCKITAAQETTLTTTNIPPDVTTTETSLAPTTEKPTEPSSTAEPIETSSTAEPIETSSTAEPTETTKTPTDLTTTEEPTELTTTETSVTSTTEEQTEETTTEQPSSTTETTTEETITSTTENPTDSTTSEQPTSTTEPSTTPEIDCPSGPDVLIYFPYDGDCQKYWECFDGNKYLYTCPPGLWWHQEVSNCDYPGSYCVAATTTEISRPTGGHDPRCVGNGTSYWPQADCSTYVECIDENSYIVDCPSNLYFSDDVKKCISKEESRCCQENGCD